MRKALYPKTSKIKTYNIVGFDIETYSKKNKFYLCGIYDHDYKCFMTIKDTIHELNKYKTDDYRIVATNLGFDFCGIYINEKEFFDHEIIMKDGNFITIKRDNVLFLDTINFTKSSVKNLGEMLNLPKLVKPKFLGKKPKSLKELKYLKDYNRIDCLISKSFIEYFQKAINDLGGELRLTIASTALDLFQRKYLKNPIYHEKYDVKELVFKAYYGGRTEAIYRGSIKDYLLKNNATELYYYDFNSLYPSVMLNKFPKPSSCKKVSTPNIQNILKYEGVSLVDIETPYYMMYPLLPCRHDNKLVFPLGSLNNVAYTHLELRQALKEGYIINKIYEQIIYTKTFYPFKKYVNDLYNKRLKYKSEKNDIMSFACKILLNSLYGKFGSRSIEEINFFPINNTKKRSFERLGNSNIGYNITETDCDNVYVIPILSCYVTSYARLKLYDTISKCDPIYYDTDSVFTLKKLVTSEGLGSLKLEHIIYKGVIIKPKAYLINDSIKFKGVKGVSLPVFNDILSNKPISQVKFLKLKEAITRRLTVNEIISFFKVIDLVDNKRNWRGKTFNRYKIQSSYPLILK